MSNAGQISPLMQELSSYTAGALKRKLPAEVVERAKLHLVDTFAAILSGSRLHPGKLGIAHVKPLSGMREAGVIGTRALTSTLYAAFANSMSGHADESDDTHTPTRTHPGINVVPAALAIAERDQIQGRMLLRAIVLGYDICTRTVLALKDRHLVQAGQTPGCKGGLFGAAAAAGALLKLDARKMRYMYSYCAQQTSGLFTILRDTHHVEKAYALGAMPTHAGVASALMVKSGFTGVDDVLSGEPNFYSVFSPDADRAALVRGLGKDYKILDCSIKYWPAAGPIQGPLHVMRDLIQQYGITADNVVKVVARLPDNDFKNVDNHHLPDATVQHLLAVMLLDGSINFASGHDFARMKDPKVLKVRKTKIEAIGDASLNDPQRRWRCAMEITLKDGRKLTHQSLAAKGIAENPLTRREQEEKALDLMAPALGKQRSRALMSALFDIEDIKNVRALRKLYAA